MKREAKAKASRQFGGADFVQFLIALAVLKKWSNSSYSFKSTETKQLARQGIKQNLSLKQMRRTLPLLLSPSFFYAFY